MIRSCASIVMLTCFVALAGAAPARSEEPVQQTLASVPAEAIAACEADLRGYLDARMATRVGPILFAQERMTKLEKDGSILVSQYWGRAPMAAYLFFDAYDLLGDKKYLQVALDLANYYLRVQEPEGFWHFAHIVTPSGQARRVEHKDAPGKAVCRIQDNHQSGCFYLMLYAWRVTGEQKYFDAAKRCANYLRSIQNENGTWPDYWIPGTQLEGRTGYAPGKAGVLIGASFNDGATTDPMWMMVVMYHLTKDAKYVERIPRIGQWLFDTQLGQGKVRGWCQQYGLDNKPLAARHFEQAVIEPRTFTRFVVPLAQLFYAMSGEERYMTLLEETVAWVTSVEKPGPDGGWAYQYLPDGTPCFSTGGQIYRLDKPETWPSPLPKKGGGPGYSRDNGGVGDAPAVLKKWKEQGVEGIRAQYRGPVTLDADKYAAARLSAARFVASKEAIAGVMEGPLKKCDPKWEPGEVTNPKFRGDRTLTYLMRLRIAQGKFTPEQLATGGAPHPAGTRLHSFKVENWLDIPWPRK